MNRLHSSLLALPILASIFLAPRLAHAAESYSNCAGFIASVPAVINTPGTWCLDKNLSTVMYAGKAINIAADDVTIDCNDFKLDGLGGGMGTSAVGVYALNRSNATVRHCNIRGFYQGVFFDGTTGGHHAVEDNRFDGITYVGIWLKGNDSVVQRNRIFDTGGSTVAGTNRAYGIYVVYDVDVLDNTVSGVLATTGRATGIGTTPIGSSVVDGNRVRGVSSGTNNRARGIWDAGNGRTIFRGNHLVDGGDGDVGILCGTGDVAFDNVISGYLAAISGCTNGGRNLIVP